MGGGGGRQTDKQTDGQTDRQTETETETERQRQRGCGICICRAHAETLAMIPVSFLLDDEQAGVPSHHLTHAKPKPTFA